MNPSAYPADSAPTNGLLLLVDGHAYAYRAFYAIRHLRSPSSAPVNAIYGFIRILRRNQELIRLRDESRGEAFRAEDFLLKPGRREELRSLYARWGFSIPWEDGTNGAGAVSGARSDGVGLFEGRLGGTPSELAGGDARAT